MQQWCCVSFFGSGGKQFLVLRTYLMYNTVVRLCHFCCCGGKVCYQDRKKKIQSSVWRVRDLYYDRKKKYNRLSGGCAIIITTGKKNSSRDYYAKLNVSNQNVTNLYQFQAITTGKKFQLSVWRVVLLCQFLVLAITKGKKKFQSSVWRVVM